MLAFCLAYDPQKWKYTPYLALTGEPWGVFGEYSQDLNSGEWEILLQRIENIRQLNVKSTAWDVRLVAIVFNMDTGV